MNRYPYRPVHALGEDDISAQFEGVEIEFDDKVTLFPVQVEQDERPRRSRARSLQSVRKPS